MIPPMQYQNPTSLLFASFAIILARPPTVKCTWYLRQAQLKRCLRQIQFPDSHAMECKQCLRQAQLPGSHILQVWKFHLFGQPVPALLVNNYFLMHLRILPQWPLSPARSPVTTEKNLVPSTL